MGDSCHSATIKESTGTCKVFAKDRNTAGLTSSDGEMYFEKYCSGNNFCTIFNLHALVVTAVSWVKKIHYYFIVVLQKLFR